MSVKKNEKTKGKVDALEARAHEDRRIKCNLYKLVREVCSWLTTWR